MEAGKPRYLFAHLTLSTDNIIIVSIIALMTIVLSYSLGVERGKTMVGVSKKETRVEPVAVKKKVVPAVTSGKPSFPQPLEIKQKGISLQQSIQPQIVGKTPEQIIKDFYTIQVASFKSENYANKEAMALKQKGFEIFVVAKGSYSIVCVGKFQQEHEAKSFSRKLRTQYKDCLISR